MEPIRAELPRPLFLYGTLCALPLLAWVLTDSAGNANKVSSLLRPAKVIGYKLVAVKNCDYPAVILDTGSTIKGYVLQPQTTIQRRKLDDFEGSTYKAVPATAYLVPDTRKGDVDDGVMEPIDTDIYVWDGDIDELTSETWELGVFIKKCLGDWISLFEGTTLIEAGYI